MYQTPSATIGIRKQRNNLNISCSRKKYAERVSYRDIVMHDLFQLQKILLDERAASAQSLIWEYKGPRG